MRPMLMAMAIVLVMAGMACGQCENGQCPPQGCGIQGRPVPFYQQFQPYQPYVNRQPMAPPRPRVQTAVPQNGLVQITSSVRDGDVVRRRHGSGAMIYIANDPRRGYVLTCGHILAAGWQIEVQGEQWRLPATVLISDASLDCAVLIVREVPATARYFSLDLTAGAGTVVSYNGWSEPGFLRLTGKIVRGIGRAIVGTGRVLEGMSGGPYLSRHGIVGVIAEWTEDGQGEVSGASAAAIHRWIIDAGYGYIVGERPLSQAELPGPAEELPPAPVPEPSRPVADPPLPLPGPGDQQSGGNAVVDLRLTAVVEEHTRIIANHETRILAIEALEQRPGQAGPVGPKGEKGDQGAGYVLTEADREEIAARIPAGGQAVRIALLDGEGRVYRVITPDEEGVIGLPAVRLQTFDGAGNYHSETTAPIGEPLGLSAEFVSRKGN